MRARRLSRGTIEKRRKLEWLQKRSSRPPNLCNLTSLQGSRSTTTKSPCVRSLALARSAASPLQGARRRKSLSSGSVHQPLRENDRHLKSAEALYAQALRLTSRGKYARAAVLFRRAISLAEGCSGSSWLFVAALWNDFGVLSKYAGRFERSEKLYRRAGALIPRKNPRSGEFRATLCHNLAGLEHARARYARALFHARRGLRLRKALHEMDPLAIAADEAALAAILVDLGRLREAKALLRRVLRAYRRRFGEQHAETASSLANLGALYARAGRLRAAERAFRQALPALENILGRKHPRLAGILNNLAVVCARRGKLGESDALYKRVLRLLSRQSGPGYPSIALVRANRKKLQYSAHRLPAPAHGAH
jgi:tetratricopeptide (TPR) repeat protein